jgi:hypothetical protein
MEWVTKIKENLKEKMIYVQLFFGLIIILSIVAAILYVYIKTKEGLENVKNNSPLTLNDLNANILIIANVLNTNIIKNSKNTNSFKQQLNDLKNYTNKYFDLAKLKKNDLVKLRKFDTIDKMQQKSIINNIDAMLSELNKTQPNYNSFQIKIGSIIGTMNFTHSRYKNL